MFPKQKKLKQNDEIPYTSDDASKRHRTDNRPCERFEMQRQLHAAGIVFSCGRRILPARPLE